MTVRELLQRMDSAELTEWIAYLSIEPIGDERSDIHSALLAAVMANAWSRKRWSPKDFLPQWWGRRVQTEEEVKAIMRSMASGQ